MHSLIWSIRKADIIFASVDKIYLYAKDWNGPKSQILIKKCEDIGIKFLNNPKAVIECSNTMNDVNSNLNDYNLIRKPKNLSYLMTWLLILTLINMFSFLDGENWIYLLCLWNNLIFLFQKKSD